MLSNLIKKLFSTQGIGNIPKNSAKETSQLPTPVISATVSEKLVSNVLSKNSGIWEYPPLSLLSESYGEKADRGDVKHIGFIIENTLQSFGIVARVAEVNLGPTITQYALKIAIGTKIADIKARIDDLALATVSPSGKIRIEAPIPGRNLIGIEIPNYSLEIVSLRALLASQVMQKSKSKLTIALGLDVTGCPIVADIAKMPHLLIAGSTNSGKSVAIHTYIASILFRASPAEVKFILIDTKRIELTAYNAIPHLLTPVIVEPEKILSSLKWAVGEMDRRYRLFAERGVRNIATYNELAGFQALPYIVIVIDDFADVMEFAFYEVEDCVIPLSRMARPAGIHLIITTQKPTTEVITSQIKTNITARISFWLPTKHDFIFAPNIVETERLLGRGDMFYLPPEQASPIRIQGGLTDEKEIRQLVEYLKQKNPI